MILLLYSNSSIKGTEILGSVLYLSLLRLAILYVCNLEENLLFSTLILGSVFNDYVVFYGDPIRATPCLMLFLPHLSADILKTSTT